jgi:hypothetical protein
MHSVDTITDTELAIAEEIAQALALAQITINQKSRQNSNGLETELKSIVSYLSSRIAQTNDSSHLIKYLDAMIKHSEKIASEVDKNSDQRKNSPRYYREIRQACELHLDLHKYKLTKVAQILGWSARLIRYYKEENKTSDRRNASDSRKTKNETLIAKEHPIAKALQRPK